MANFAMVGEKSEEDSLKRQFMALLSLASTPAIMVLIAALAFPPPLWS